MRKVGILVLTMILVFGMSTISFASNLDMKELDVGVKVNQYGNIDIGEPVPSEDTATVSGETNVIDLRDGNNKIVFPLTVHSNDSMVLKVEENVSEKIRDDLVSQGKSADLVWAFDDDGYGIIRPNVSVKDQTWATGAEMGDRYKTTSGIKRVINLPRGTFNGDLEFNVDIATNNSEFTKINQGTYTGKVTVTIEPQS